MIWANARDEPWRSSQGVPADAGLDALRLVNLPGYSPDFNGEEAMGDLCLRTKARVQERVSHFLAELIGRKQQMKRRCRIILQSKGHTLLRD